MTKDTHDTLMMGILVFGGPAVLIWFLSTILDRLAALKATPDVRAKITVGIPYFAAVVFVAAYVRQYARGIPVIGLPSRLLG